MVSFNCVPDKPLVPPPQPKTKPNPTPNPTPNTMGGGAKDFGRGYGGGTQANDPGPRAVVEFDPIKFLQGGYDKKKPKTTDAKPGKGGKGGKKK
jgi:hypothetical protein